MLEAKFLCYWDSYDDDAIVEYRPVEFFSEDIGYQPDDIATIRDMRRGESLDLSDGIGQRHYVLRIN
jgi:hypothetical protein